MRPRLPPQLRLRKGGTPLAEARVAADPVSRFLGLMGQRHLPAGSGLLLVPCNSIHTWFMRFAIDVVFLDPDFRVVRVVAVLPPWHFSPLVRGARMTLELPAGTARLVGISAGDVLLWEPQLPMR